MKKIALTSLLAVFAVSGANAAAKNVMDGNPLYMPKAGHFFSETTLGSETKDSRDWTLGERFGLGITDNFAIALKTSMSEVGGFENFAWNEIGLDMAYRFVGEGAWKVDLIGAYEVGPMRAYHHNFADEDLTTYVWTAGVRTGYVNKDWSLMAHANFMYANSESFNWAYDDDMWANHILNIGFGGFWKMSDYWSGVVTADYYKILDHYGEPEAAGYWDLTAGLNLNIDATKYIGAYITKEINHVGKGDWEAQDGVGFGAKFGIDF